jgi:hypothetical protein
MKSPHPPVPPMTPGNMREQGVHHQGRRNDPSSRSLVLNGTNDRGEYGAARASGDHL